jgi:chromate transporter
MSAWLLYLLLLKATLISFSGLSSLPVVRDELVVQYGVLSDSQLNAAVALARAAPGPFGGYVISVGYFANGVTGGIAGWLALITPALLAIPLVHYVARSTAHPRARSMVNAVVIASAALILVATVPIAAQALGSAVLIVIAAASTLILAATGLQTVWVIAAAAATGLLAAGFGAPL